MKLHSYYNTEDYLDKVQDMVFIRKQILQNFDQHKTIEKRIQRYLLMADDSGIQSAMYLLLVLSDDEIKGSKACEIPFDLKGSI